jgi:CRP-like cAMP-binding protein
MPPPSPLLRLFDGEALFREGDPADHFYLIETGRVMILDRSGDQLVASYECDQLLGISEVLARTCWRHTAVAAGATILRVFPAHLLFRRIDAMPAAHQQIITEVAALGR